MKVPSTVVQCDLYVFVWYILYFFFFVVCLAFLFHMLEKVIFYPADLQAREPSENAGEKLQVLEGIDKKLRQGGSFFVLQ